MILWISHGGRVACKAHGGSYLAAAMLARPRARRHVTPLDVWWRITAADRATWREAGLGKLACEDCP